MKVKFLKIRWSKVIEQKINEALDRIKREGCIVHSVQYLVRSNQRSYLMIGYEESTGTSEPGISESKTIEANGPSELIPLISAKSREGKQMDCMAGVMGVPPGWSLEGDDLPAPAPLISSDFDLTEWADLFKGIPGRDLDGRVKTAVPLRHHSKGRGR